jgi:hypothetical protein
MRMRHIVICGLLRSTKIFHHYLINGMIFEIKLLKIRCVFRVSLQILSEKFFILTRIEQDTIKNIYLYVCKVSFIFVLTIIKLEFYRQIFKEHSNIKFHENPSSESRVVLCRKTDGRTEMTKLIVAFRNFANASKNCVREN